MSRPAAEIAKPAIGWTLKKLVQYYRKQGYSNIEAVQTAKTMLSKVKPMKGKSPFLEQLEPLRRDVGKPTGIEAIRAKGQQFLEKHPKLEKALPWAVGAGGTAAVYGAKEAFGEETIKPPPWERIISTDVYGKATLEQQNTVQKNYLLESSKYLISQGLPTERRQNILRMMRDRMLKPYVSTEEMIAKEVGVQVLPSFQKEQLPEPTYFGGRPETWEDWKKKVKSNVMQTGSDIVLALNQAAKGGTWPLHGIPIPGFEKLVDLPSGSEGTLGEFFKKTETAIDEYRFKEGFPQWGAGAKMVPEFAGMGGMFKYLHKASTKIMSTPAMGKAFGELAIKIGGPKANIVKKAVQEAMTMGFFESFHGSGWKEKLAFITGGGVLGGIGGAVAEKAVAKSLIEVKQKVARSLSEQFPGEIIHSGLIDKGEAIALELATGKKYLSGLTEGEAVAMDFYTGRKLTSGLSKEEVVAGTINKMFDPKLPVEADKQFIETILEYNIEANPELKTPSVMSALELNRNKVIKPNEIIGNQNMPLTATIDGKEAVLEGQPYAELAAKVKGYIIENKGTFNKLEGSPPKISMFLYAMGSPEKFAQKQALKGWESHVNYVNKASKQLGLGSLNNTELGYQIGVMLQGQGKLGMVSSADPRAMRVYEAAMKVQPDLAVMRLGNTSILYRNMSVARTYMMNKDWLTGWGAGSPELEALINQSGAVAKEQRAEFFTRFNEAIEGAIEKSYREGLQDIYKGKHAMGQRISDTRRMPVAPTNDFVSNKGTMIVSTVGDSGAIEAKQIASEWTINESLLDEAITKIDDIDKIAAGGHQWHDIEKLAAQKGGEITAVQGKYLATHADEAVVVNTLEELVERVGRWDKSHIPESPMVKLLADSAKAEEVPIAEYNNAMKNLSDGLAEWVTKIEAAEKAEPLISKLPKFSLKPWAPQLPSAAVSYVEPPKYALQSFAQAFEMPEVYRVGWENINTAQREVRQFTLPFSKRLEKIFKGVSENRMEKWSMYMETKAEEKAAKAVELGLKPGELKKLDQLRVWFDDMYKAFGIEAPYVEDYMSRMRLLGEKTFKAKPTDLREKMAADFVRTGFLSPKEMNAREIAYGYLMRNAKSKFLVPEVNKGLELLNRREAVVIREGDKATSRLGGYLLPEDVRIVLDGYFRSVLGMDDQLAHIMRRSVADTFESLHIPGAEDLAKSLLDNMFTMNYGAFMAGRPKLIIRNITQPFMTTYPYLETGFFGRAYKEALTKEGWNFARNAGIFTEMPVVRGEELMTGAGRLMRIKKGIKFGLLGYRKADSLNRAVSYIGGYRQAEYYGNLFKRGKISRKKLVDKTLDFYAPDVRSRALDLLDDSVARFADYVGNHLVEDSQWIYRAGGQPRMFQSSLGRLFGQYGTWPIYHNDQMYRILKYPKFKNKVKWFSKTYAARGALWTALYAGFGVGVKNWIYWSPMGFSGGPWGNLGLDYVDAFMGWGAEKALAETRLKYNLGGTKMLLPGLYLYRDLSKALAEPTLKKKAIRFTLGPIKNEEGFFVRDSVGGAQEDEVFIP